MNRITEDHEPLEDIFCPRCAKELAQKTARCPKCGFEHPAKGSIPSIKELSNLQSEHMITVSPAYLKVVISRAMQEGWLEEMTGPPDVNEE